MPDSIKVRIFVDAPLTLGAEIALDRSRSHYLGHVMRKGVGDILALFNGRDGEWRARVTSTGKGGLRLEVDRRIKAQMAGADLWLIFAPIKRQRIDLVAEKASEIGVSVLQPVTTRNTMVERVNLERLRANAIEAAECCHRLDIPEVRPAMALDALLRTWPAGRRLIVGDERGEGRPIAEALAGLLPAPAAVLIGPEGGFTSDEFDRLSALPETLRVDLGPRLLRADTAAISALAVYQACVGDWRQARPKSLIMT